MADLQAKMVTALEEALGKDKKIEYYVYGTIAPTFKKMLLSFLLSIVMLVALLFVPIHFIWKIVILLVYVILLVRFYTMGVYIGKYGKRMYLYEMDFFGRKKDCNEILLKFVNVDTARSDLNSHVMLMFEIDDEVKYIMVKKEGSKLPIRQSVNFTALITDIVKRHK